MIDVKEIEKLAQLSRLDLSPQEKETFRKEIETILEYVSQIEQASVNIKQSSPLASAKNILRPDEESHLSQIHTEKILSQAPNREGHHIKVKKIIQT